MRKGVRRRKTEVNLEEEKTPRIPRWHERGNRQEETNYEEYGLKQVVSKGERSQQEGTADGRHDKSQVKFEGTGKVIKVNYAVKRTPPVL